MSLFRNVCRPLLALALALAAGAGGASLARADRPTPPAEEPAEAADLPPDGGDTSPEPAAALTQRVFLPLVSKGGGGASLANGGFESGNANWSAYSAKGRTLIRTTFVGSVTPHAGAWAVWLGGAYNEVNRISQANVIVPANAPYLTYWRWIASADVCGYDFASVKISSTAIEVYDLCDPNDTNGWVKRTLNLSAYAGLSVTITFQAEADGSGNSNLFIDDVSFQAAP